MVGSCLAALLARDEKPAPTGASRSWTRPCRAPPDDGEVDLRVSALSRASQRILGAARRLGRRCAPHACPYADMVGLGRGEHGHDARRCAAFLRGRDRRARPRPHRREPARAVVAARIAAAARRHALAHRHDRARVRARTARGSTLDDGRRLSCQLVVGADGGQSRRRASWPASVASGWAYEQTAVVAHLRTGQPHRETAYQRFLSERSARVAAAARRPRLAGLDARPSRRRRRCRRRPSWKFGERVSAASDHVLGAADARKRPRRLSARTLARARVRAAATRTGRRRRAHDPPARGAGRQPGVPRLRGARAGARRGRGAWRRVRRVARAAPLRALATQRERADARHDRQAQPAVRASGAWPLRPCVASACRSSRGSHCCGVRWSSARSGSAATCRARDARSRSALTPQEWRRGVES